MPRTQRTRTSTRIRLFPAFVPSVNTYVSWRLTQYTGGGLVVPLAFAMSRPSMSNPGLTGGVWPEYAVGRTHPVPTYWRSCALAKLFPDGLTGLGSVHCVASRRTRSTHIRAIELAMSVFRASRFP